MSSTHAIRPSKWEVQHMSGLKAGEAYIAEHHELPLGPIWQKLEHRYEANTKRFRLFHPETASILDQLKAYKLTDSRHEPHDGHPFPPTTGSLVTPDCPIQTVAEPGSVISLMVGVVLLFACMVGRG